MADRNTNARYEMAPRVEIERSSFPMNCNIKTSFNVGELIPFYCQEIVPGDGMKIETAKAFRLQTLITPVMDNLYLDTYYFFVPNRLIWEHWEEFCGANKTSAWVPQVEYTVPQIYAPAGIGWNVGTIADYFGVCTGVYDSYGPINALPFRAYAKIVEDWFRDENLQNPISIYTGDSAVQGTNGDVYWKDIELGGKPFIACKYHDYFTSCLPAPQKGPDVTFIDGLVPVKTNANKVIDTGVPAMTWANASTGAAYTTQGYIEAANTKTVVSSHTPTGSASVVPANLVADLSNGVLGGASQFTINALRQAFQVQRLFEKDARNGTRYIEILKGHFGVTSPDARLQRAEYLGGNRVPFNIEQVLQTSSTDNVTPQGNVSGWSLTNDDSFDVDKSFVEHGYVIGLMVARYDHSYQQGMECHWFRKRRFDYYWPALAHLGEKAVYSKEICWTGDPTYDDEVFGYQEAWAEYRYKPNYITGQLRSQYDQSLDFWHFGDYYFSVEDDQAEPPELSAEWIVEDKSNVDRCLAVPSDTANQIFGDILVKCNMTRPMPLYSIPGLVDHF